MAQQTDEKKAESPQCGGLSPVASHILRLIAEGLSATAIVARPEIAAGIGRGEATEEWVKEVSDILLRPAWAQATIDEYRKSLCGNADGVPIRYRAYRLRRLQRILDSPEASPQDQLQALVIAHEQSGDKYRPAAPAVDGGGKGTRTAQK